MLANAVTTTLQTRIGPVPVRVVGDGPPDGPTVLAVHGLLVDGRLWDGVAARLAPYARIVLPDLPLGSHRAAVPDRSRLTPTEVAAALADLLDGLGAPTATLLANDSGGALAQIAAAGNPDRFPALVLTTCDSLEHFPPPLLRPVRALAAVPGVARLVCWLFARPPLLKRPGPLNLLTARPVDPALVDDWLRPPRVDAGVRRDLIAFFRACRPRLTLAAAEKLRSYAGRIVLVWSRQGVLFPSRDGERLAAALPRAELRWVDGALTFVPLDRPDAVADAVRDVLAAASDRST